jgi:hypothetical protein
MRPSGAGRSRARVWSGATMDSGIPEAEASAVFSRERRRRALSAIASRLRHEPDDVGVMLPFEEVVGALGRRSQRDLGIRTIPLDSIVGTVDRKSGFDREFRPTTSRVRTRWERIAAAMRRGDPLPPISVYRIGEVHFVRDGHHRVSVARALGLREIDAFVTEVLTRVGADRALRISDLPSKDYERLFFERVPLPPAARSRISLSDPYEYTHLAEGIEAWGFRLIQDRAEVLDRREVARQWFEREYVPVVAMLREADMLREGTETEAYMRVADERYRLLRTHEWSEDVVSRLRDAGL